MTHTATRIVTTVSGTDILTSASSYELDITFAPDHHEDRNNTVSIEFQSNVTSHVCLNLEDLCNSYNIIHNVTSSYGLPIFRLNGLNYSRFGAWGGDPSYDTSVTYDLWQITLRPLDFQGQGASSWNHTAASARTQVNFYEEKDCHHSSHAWYGYSCVTTGTTGKGDFGAKSISLQPNEPSNDTCLYFARNGQNAAVSLLWGPEHAGLGRMMLSAALMAFLSI